MQNASPNLNVTEILTEITPGLLPHEYHLNSAGKLVGFRPQNGELKMFAEPKIFSKSYRKFNKVRSG